MTSTRFGLSFLRCDAASFLPRSWRRSRREGRSRRPIRAHRQSGASIPAGASGAVDRPAEGRAPAADQRARARPAEARARRRRPLPAASARRRRRSAGEGQRDRRGRSPAGTSPATLHVETAAGHGFDEAALEVAKGLVFQPATRDGKPIPARVKHLYVFVPSRRARLAGRVLSASRRAPSPGATVVARAPDGTEKHVDRPRSTGAWTIDRLAARHLPPHRGRRRLQAARGRRDRSLRGGSRDGRSPRPGRRHLRRRRRRGRLRPREGAPPRRRRPLALAARALAHPGDQRRRAEGAPQSAGRRATAGDLGAPHRARVGAAGYAGVRRWDAGAHRLPLRRPQLRRPLRDARQDRLLPGQLQRPLRPRDGGHRRRRAGRAEERQAPRARAVRSHRRARARRRAHRRRVEVRRRGAALVARRVAEAGARSDRRRGHRGARLLRLPGAPREELGQGEAGLPRRFHRLRRPARPPHHRRERQRPDAHRRDQRPHGLLARAGRLPQQAERRHRAAPQRRGRGRLHRRHRRRASTSTSPTFPISSRIELAQKIAKDATMDFGLDLLYEPYNVFAQLPHPTPPGQPPPGPVPGAPAGERRT